MIPLGILATGIGYASTLGNPVTTILFLSGIILVFGGIITAIANSNS